MKRWRDGERERCILDRACYIRLMCHGFLTSRVPSNSSRIQPLWAPKVDQGASDAELEPRDGRFTGRKHSNKQQQSASSNKKQATRNKEQGTRNHHNQTYPDIRVDHRNNIKHLCIYIYIEHINPEYTKGIIKWGSDFTFWHYIRSSNRGGWTGWADQATHGSYGRGRFDAWILQYLCIVDAG